MLEGRLVEDEDVGERGYYEVDCGATEPTEEENNVLVAALSRCDWDQQQILTRLSGTARGSVDIYYPSSIANYRPRPRV